MSKRAKSPSSGNFIIAEAEYFRKKIKKGEGVFFESKLLDYVYPQLRLNPFFGLNIKKLKGEWAHCYRYRIGDYRLFYTIDVREKKVILFDLENRKDAY